MPISFTSDADARIVHSRGTGRICVPDLLSHVSAMAAAGVLAYDQVLDLTGASLLLTYEDARSVVQSQHVGLDGARGGVTVIASDDKASFGSARILEALMSFQGLRYSVFSEVEAAQHYLRNRRAISEREARPAPSQLQRA